MSPRSRPRTRRAVVEGGHRAGRRRRGGGPSPRPPRCASSGEPHRPHRARHDRRRAADDAGGRGAARRGGGRRLCDRRRGPRAGARRARPLRPRPARHARPAVRRSRPVRPRPRPDLLQPALRAAVRAEARFPRRPARVQPACSTRCARPATCPRSATIPSGRRSIDRWFTGGLAAEEEDWLLPGGKHLRVVAQPLPDGGLLLIFEDRTEQLQLASARDTLLRVRTATFDNLFEAVGVFASDGRLHLWNNRFRELWEFEEEQLAGHPRIDALTAAYRPRSSRMPSHAALVRELVRSATVERKQRTGRVAFTDGREFEFAAVPLPDGNALFTMLDVTASRTVEAALRERNEALEEADRLKTAFVSNMSYELRTPLTSIGGFAEMLAGGYAGELAPTADRICHRDPRIGRPARRADRRRARPHPERQRQPAARRGQGRPRASSAPRRPRRSASRRRRRASISRSRSRPAPASIAGDRAACASRSTTCSRTPSPIPTRAAGSCSTPPATARRRAITVSDNGRGIAPADQARVFDRFHRTAEPRGADEAALGLGLPLARQFVEAHGGTIELRLRAGRGHHRHPPPAAEALMRARRRRKRPRRSAGALARAASRRRRRRPVRRARRGQDDAGARHPRRPRPRGRGRQPDLSDRHALRRRSRLPVWHVDLYRIEDPAELEELALDEALEDGALIVEWPERLGDALWPHALRLTLRRRGEGARALTAGVPRRLGGAMAAPMIPPAAAPGFPCRSMAGRAPRSGRWPATPASAAISGSIARRRDRGADGRAARA